MVDKTKLKTLDWKSILGNPLRVGLYALLGYLVTVPVDQWAIKLSDSQKGFVVAVLMPIFSGIYNATKAYKNQ